MVAVYRRQQQHGDGDEKTSTTSAGHAVSRTESFSRRVKEKLGLSRLSNSMYDLN